MKEEFIEFMVGKELWELYLKWFEKYREGMTVHQFLTKMEKRDCRHFVTGAFAWGKPNSHSFRMWNAVSKEWRLIVRNK